MNQKRGPGLQDQLKAARKIQGLAGGFTAPTGVLPPQKPLFEMVTQRLAEYQETATLLNADILQLEELKLLLEAYPHVGKIVDLGRHIGLL